MRDTSLTQRSARVAPSRRWRRAFGMTTALAILVIVSIGTTALLIHLSWSYTARANIADIVRQLNGQIAMTVQQKVEGVVAEAGSLQDTVQSTLSQGNLAPGRPADLEALLVPLLRSQNEISWIALGFPDGNFFGVQKVDDDELDIVEVERTDGGSRAVMRISRYRIEPNRMILLGQAEQPTDYDSRREEWYGQAIAAGSPGWTRLPHLPNSERNAIARSAPLVIRGTTGAVVTIAIEVDRLSRFLGAIAIGHDSTVTVIDPTGYVVASPDDATIRQQRGDRTPTLDDLAGRSLPVALVKDLIHRYAVSIEGLAEPRQWRMAEAATGRDYFVTLTPLVFQGWLLATVIPSDNFLASVDRNSRLLLIALGVLTLVMALGATAAAQGLVGRPLLRIAAQLKHVERFELDQIRFIPSPLREVDDFSAALLTMTQGLNSFRKYIPSDLVRTLLARGIVAMPGGTQQELTVMFTDIVGFTRLSETLGAAIVPLLGQYLEINTAAILATGGTIDKFIGDAVMAFWGAPVPNPRHALDSCIAALDAQRRLAASGTGLQMRVGLNTGTMLVGNIGSSERLGYTVIGDAVNVASRLETASKHYGTSILIGEATRAAAGDAILVRRLDRIAVYGRVGGITIYELLGLAGGPMPGWVADYEAGLAAYEGRRWSAAIAHFDAVIAARGQDTAAALLIARCRQLLDSPPDADWQPLAVLESK